MERKRPVLIVARASPNELAGTPIILRRLLENFGFEEVVVLSRKAKREREIEKNFRYPVVETFAPEVKGRKVIAFFSGLVTGFRVIRKYNPRAILAIYPDDGALMLGYWLHRLSGLPLASYFCDLYLENKKGVELMVARWLQKRVFDGSIFTVSVNAGMQSFYRQRYQMETLLLPTAINKAIPTEFELPEYTGRLIIGFSGNVSRDRVQPFRELIRLAQRRGDIEIRYFVPHTREYLEANSVWLEGSEIRFCRTEDELLSELRQCHALYLPLTFKVEDDSVEQLATCFGIKSYEYILACRPVLVHCPSDYFTYRFFAEDEAGILAADLDGEDLSVVLDNFISDYKANSTTMVKNALNKAKMFKGELLADRLRKELDNTL